MNTTTPKTYHQSNIQASCIFCYKSCNQDYQNGKSRTKEHQFVGQVQARFFQMVQRYFEYKRKCGWINASSSSSSSVLPSSCEQLKLPQEGEGEVQWKVGCCSDCFNIVESYCDFYHKMKVVEMELDRKLDTLNKIMRYADRVPSRISEYRDWCLRERLDMEKSMNFRRKFQKECEMSKRRSFPTVKVNPKEAQNGVRSTISTNVQDNISSSQTPQCQRSGLVIVSTSTSLPVSSEVTVCLNDQSDQDHAPSDAEADIGLPLDLTNIKISQSPLKQVVNDSSSSVDYPIPLASIKVSQSPDDEPSDFPSPPASPEVEVTEPFLKRIKLSSPEVTASACVSPTAREAEPTLTEEQINHEKSADLDSPRRRKIRQLSKCTICKATFSAPAKLESHISEAHQSSNCHDDDDEDVDDYNAIALDKDAADDDWVVDEEYVLQADNELTRESLNKPENKGKSSPPLPGVSCNDHENQQTDKETSQAIKKDITVDESITLAINAASLAPVPVLPSQIIRKGEFVCKKCPEISYETLLKLQTHHNYMHTNGQHKMTWTEFFTILRRSQKSLKLKGIKGDTILKCCQLSRKGNACPMKFMLKEELENHMKYHEQVKCETCSKKMDNVVDMVVHEIEHLADEETGPGKLTCRKCSFIAMNQGELVDHHLEIHRNNKGLLATCPICLQEFKYVEKVPLMHYVNYHDLTRIEDPSSSGIPCIVEKCPAYFLTEDQLQQHCSSVHVKKSVEVLDRENRKALKKKKIVLRSNRLKLARKQRGIQCDACQRKFCDEKQLRSHQLMTCINVNRKKLEEYGKIQLTEDGMTIDDFMNGKNVGNFACKLCNRSFELKEYLEKHIKLHGDFKCNFCDVIKTHATELAVHEIVHNVDKPNKIDIGSFKCPRCKFTTMRRSVYIKHHVETHLGMEMESERKQCPICKKEVKDKSWNSSPRNWMILHYFEYHDKLNLNYKTMPKCNQCPAYFRTDFQLETHLKKIHNFKCQCGTCGKIFKDWSYLRNHRKKTHRVDESTFEFACDFPDCGRKFEFEMERNSHKKGSHSQGAMQMCQECGRTFVGTFQLKLHMTTHEEKKDTLHVCEECGKVFTTGLKLYNHRVKHKNIKEKKFVCKICSKVCLDGGKLKEHSRTHTKEKPFVCQMCGASYAHAHNLRIHTKNKHQDS